ncbi:two-component response regulator-like APRR9 isoform X1 [Vicia villosa]|uniref:two-component response regulator-like APRR9 isoform X1 n=2 Tax=Vicia villosa TaxID=3911 RepID=UPI00273ABC81|nr:two-component response regulator-like APRR9 isoform X1 [Vicia villosa]
MNESEKKKNDGDDHCKEVFRWELFLPKKTVTVLLVESDRSTRRLITSLLMNCNYKVIAVSDGVKAWKTLQMKEIDVDIVLAEMELPEISGLALLSLMVEHETCRNIPLIMMSSHDSRGMVMNCMCKGAADFLIKPVRKNELMNLWQHVWRKHVLNRPLQNTSAQDKLKIAIEDNFTGNQSTDSVSVASSQKNNECSVQLSEAQVTKLEREPTKLNDEARDSRLEQDYRTSEVESKNELFRGKLSRENHDNDTDTEIRGCSDELIEPSCKAIDLISTVGNLQKRTKEIHCITGDEETKFDFEKELELSLRSDYSGSSCKQASEATEEWQRLNHSNTSAFSQYDGSKMLWPLFQNYNWSSNNPHELSVVTADKCIQYGGPIKIEDMTNAVTAHYGQFGPKLFNTGLLADNVLHHMRVPKANFQKESSPFPSSSSSQSNPESHNSDHHHNCSYDANYSFLNQNVAEKYDLDHVVHDSPSVGSGFGNDICQASNYINSGNDERATSNLVTKNSRSSNDCRRNRKDSYDYDYDDDEFRLSDSHRSSQREAALTKFRLKRKERCFAKKVRYQSRKKIAEQRLRVKGQFVRRVYGDDDHPNADANGDQ